MHEGHRQRLYDKFSRDTKALSDHEILELMLFPLLPRVNTNAIAHDLLSAFGDLNGVLGATEKQLCTVRGIGSSAARSLAVIGEAFRRQGGVVRKKPKIMGLHDVKEIVRELFEDCDTEKVEMLLLNASRRLMLVKTVTDYKIDSVGIPPMESRNARIRQAAQRDLRAQSPERQRAAFFGRRSGYGHVVGAAEYAQRKFVRSYHLRERRNFQLFHADQYERNLRRV